MTEETLYERLGGEEAISAVVDRFYDRVTADERLEEFFEGVNMTQLRAHQTQFISSVTGGPVDYTGDDMYEAHKHLDLDEGDFAAVAGHLRASLEEFDVPEEEINEVMTAVAGLEDDILGRNR